MSIKKTTPTPQTKVLYRSAVNGRFITPTYANSHKATTEREVRRIISGPSVRSKR